jgi:hypothetical protein
MKIPIQFMLLSFFATLFGCTPKYAEIHFGQNGGVTDKNPVYLIKETGDLLIKKSEGKDFELVRKLNGSELKTVYKKIKAAELPTLDINTPDNVSKFIEIRNQEGQSVNKVMWGNPQGKLTAELSDLYNYLLSVTKTAKVSMR